MELPSGALGIRGLSWGLGGPVPAGGPERWGLWLTMFIPLPGGPASSVILEMLTQGSDPSGLGLGGEDSGVESKFHPKQPVLHLGLCSRWDMGRVLVSGVPHPHPNPPSAQTL